MRPALLILLTLLVLALPASAMTQQIDPVSDTVIVVVRHAEKGGGDPKDPWLSDAGVARSQALAKALAKVRVAAVYATQYRRTRLTGEPTAAANGVDVQVRPATAENAATYAAELRTLLLNKHNGQTVLVVGHSNTAPEIVAALSRQPAVPMADTEFDRFTLVIIGVDDDARVITSRY